MKNEMKKAGFTLVEIMIVVAIIGLLAAIGIPSFMKARDSTREKACIGNMTQIAGAIDQWAIEENKKGTEAVTLNDVSGYMRGGVPVCPAGDAAYVLTTVAGGVTCPNVADYPTHVMPGSGS